MPSGENWSSSQVKVGTLVLRARPKMICLYLFYKHPSCLNEYLKHLEIDILFRVMFGKIFTFVWQDLCAREGNKDARQYISQAMFMMASESEIEGREKEGKGK